MSNNRMYLVHDETGQRVLLAKHLGEEWKVFPGGLIERLQSAFSVEGAESGWPSTGWHLEFEHHSKVDDPLKSSTCETWQDVTGRWHRGTRPTPEDV